MNDLIVFKELNVMELFTDSKKMDGVIDIIQKEIDNFSGDMSTKKGRDAIRSFAAKIAKSKVAMDKSGKALTEDVRGKIKLINVERNRVEDKLQSMQDAVRQPLTEWEDAEKERVQGHENNISLIVGFREGLFNETSEEVKNSIAGMKDAFLSTSWQEFESRAENEYNESLSFLTARFNTLLSSEKEAAELEKLRAEKSKREAKEREELIAKEAAEAARVEAEAKAKRDADAVESKAKAEREAIETKARDEREAAEAARVEAEAKIAEAEEATRVANAKAAHAAELERRRIEQEKRDEEQAAIKREADKKHKSKINNEALSALLDAGINQKTAKCVITEIAKGNIPNIKISY